MVIKEGFVTGKDDIFIRDISEIPKGEEGGYIPYLSDREMDKYRYERPLIKKLESSMPNKFGMRTEYSPKTHIDGVAVADLIEKYGSPVFVLSEKTIRNNIRKARKALP